MILPSASTTRGLMSLSRCLSGSLWSVSSTMVRFNSPTCGAPSPTPEAAYMVCAMLSTKEFRSPLMFSTGRAV